MENVTKQKNPLLAAIGSFLVPGLGQVYNGEGYLKGLLYLIGIFVGSIIFVLPGLIIWLYSIYNAYKVAQKVNMGQIPFKETSLLSIILYIVLILVIEFIAVFVIIMFSAIIAAFVYGMTGGSSY